MKILVFSDSHGRTDSMLSVVKYLEKDVSHILHLGDNMPDGALLRQLFLGIPVYYIPGNCDYTGVPQDLLLEIEGKKLWLTHGHRYNVKAGIDRLSYAAEERSADICLFGHTHIASLTCINGVVYMNPGSISIPRGYEKTSYGVLDLSNGTQASVVEFSREGYRVIYAL